MRVVFLFFILLFACPVAIGWGPWRFIVTGDSRGEDHDDNNGVNTVILGEIANEIVREGPEFVLFIGDLVAGEAGQDVIESELYTWRDVMDPVYEAGVVVYVIRGNRDEGVPAGVEAWNSVFVDERDSGGYDYRMPENGPAGQENLTYSFSHKNAFVVGLDQLATDDRPKYTLDQEWLDGEFLRNDLPHVFVFGHFTNFKMVKGSMDKYPAQRDVFWESLEVAGGRTYFCGHDHFYDHGRVDDDGVADNDVHQLVVGGAGAPIHTWNGSYSGNNGDWSVENVYHTTRFGYVIVEVRGYNVKLTWMERESDDETVDGVYGPVYEWGYRVAYSGDSLMDLAILANHWLKVDCDDCGGADLSGDGSVDMADFVVLAEGWLGY